MKRPFNKRVTALAILAVIAAGILIFPRIRDQIADDVRVSRVYEDFPELTKRIEAYRAATGGYPTTEEGLRALVDRPTPSPPHWRRTLDSVPIDAWGNRYRYRLASREGKEVPEFYSCGKDGAPDTEDDLSSLDPR